MRITKNQLKQIIKEELSGVLREQLSPEQLATSAANLTNDELADLLLGDYGLSQNKGLTDELAKRVAAEDEADNVRGGLRGRGPMNTLDMKLKDQIEMRDANAAIIADIEASFDRKQPAYTPTIHPGPEVKLGVHGDESEAKVATEKPATEIKESRRRRKVRKTRRK
jgi:hypothetical protein